MSQTTKALDLTCKPLYAFPFAPPFKTSNGGEGDKKILVFGRRVYSFFEKGKRNNSDLLTLAAQDEFRNGNTRKTYPFHKISFLRGNFYLFHFFFKSHAHKSTAARSSLKPVRLSEMEEKIIRPKR